jgi:peroxin-19
MSAEPVKEEAAVADAPPSSQAAAPPSETQAATTTSTPAPPQETPTADVDPGDPDEDDLSDLDDVLDEFAATNISKPAPSSSGPGRPTAQPPASIPTALPGGAGPGGLFTDEDEFAKAMQAGMAELLGEFEANPDMQKQFEDLVKELGEGMGAVPGETGVLPDIPAAAAASGAGVEAAAVATPSSSSKAPESSSSPKPPANAAASFEDTIRATMERMSASNTAASDAASKSAAAPEEDFLAAMLKEMEKEGGAGGLGSDEDFSKMLMGMMEQLTNKEILYEPMKELHDKFPAWMKENVGKVGKEDWARYVEQQRLVGEIVGKFEDKGYSDGKVEYREFIVERMQQVSCSV